MLRLLPDAQNFREFDKEDWYGFAGCIQNGEKAPRIYDGFASASDTGLACIVVCDQMVGLQYATEEGIESYTLNHGLGVDQGVLIATMLRIPRNLPTAEEADALEAIGFQAC